MIPAFTWLPPEINSALMYGGAGPGTLHTAASAWEALASDLSSAASSFDSVITGLANGVWAGPASLSMAAAAAPYVGWLNAASTQAQTAAAQAVASATAFETAQSATVVPAAVTANRVTLASLIATNFFGQNTPAIGATEFQYLEMWAQDVAAMLGYHAGATSAAATLPSFSLPNPSELGQMVTSAFSGIASDLQGAMGGLTGVGTELQTVWAMLQQLGSELPLGDLSTVMQIGMYPVSMLLSPLISMAGQSATGTAGLAGAAGAAATPLAGLASAGSGVGTVGSTGLGLGSGAGGVAGASIPALGGVPTIGGGGGGLPGTFVPGVGIVPPGAVPGAGGAAPGLGPVAGGLGKARLVGSLSTPSAWEGSMPTRMSTSAMAGLGEMPTPAMAGGSPMGGPMPMPMPMGMGAGGGMPGGMLGRGGASPNTVQARPSVVPRTGV